MVSIKYFIYDFLNKGQKNQYYEHMTGRKRNAKNVRMRRQSILCSTLYKFHQQSIISKLTKKSTQVEKTSSHLVCLFLIFHKAESGNKGPHTLLSLLHTSEVPMWLSKKQAGNQAGSQLVAIAAKLLSEETDTKRDAYSENFPKVVIKKKIVTSFGLVISLYHTFRIP